MAGVGGERGGGQGGEDGEFCLGGTVAFLVLGELFHGVFLIGGCVFNKPYKGASAFSEET